MTSKGLLRIESKFVSDSERFRLRMESLPRRVHRGRYMFQWCPCHRAESKTQFPPSQICRSGFGEISTPCLVCSILRTTFIEAIRFGNSSDRCAKACPALVGRTRRLNRCGLDVSAITFCKSCHEKMDLCVSCDSTWCGDGAIIFSLPKIPRAGRNQRYLVCC